MRMPTADSRSIRALRWAARVAAVLLLVFALLFSWLTWRDQDAEAIGELGSVVELGERAIDVYFSGLENDLKGLGQDALSAAGAIDLRRARAAVNRFQALHPEALNTTIVRADGRVLITSNSPAGAAMPSVAGEPSFRESLDELDRGQALSIGRPRLGYVIKAWATPSRYALRNRSGAVQYFVSSILPVEFLQTFWRDAPITKRASIGLLRDDGFLLSRYPVAKGVSLEKVYGEPRTLGLARLLRKEQPPLSGTIEGHNSLDGPHALFVFRRLRHYPVTLYAVMPTAYIWVDWWEKVWAPYLLLLFLMGGGFAAYRVAVGRQAAWDAEQRRATGAQRESQLQLQTVIDALPQSIYLRDLDGRFQLVNSAAAGRFRMAPVELVGRTSADMPWGDPDAARRLAEGDRKLLETGGPVVVPNFRRVLPGGEERWFHLVKLPLRNATGTLTGLLSVSEDITERKLAEEKLRASERLLQTVFDTIPHVVVVKDHDGRYLMVNQAWYDVFGRSPSEVIHKHTGEIPGRPATEVAALLEQDWIVLSGSTDKVIAEDLVTVGSGDKRYLHTIKRPLRDGSGAIAGLVAVSVDVTAERAVEEKLRASERLLQTVFDTIPHVVIVKDTESRYLMVNRAWSSLFGLEPEQVLKKHIS